MPDKDTTGTLHSGISRRALVGAIAAPAVLRVIPANAQSKVIKIGHVSPRTGPLAGFGEADGFILEQVRGILSNGLADRRPHLSGADHRQGQPVERQPRRRSRLRADPRRQGRSHRRLGDARHHQSGRRPGRGQRGALHHHQLPVAAVFLRPQGRSRQGLHLDLSLLLGARGRDRRVPGAVELGADQQGRRRSLPQRCRRQRLGRSAARPAAGAREGRLQAHRSRPLPAHEQRLHVADLRVQGGQRRDRHRQHDPAGLRDLLVAGGAAGLPAEDRHHRQGAAVPVGDQLARRARQRPHQRNLVDAEPSVQVGPHRPEREGPHRRLCRGHQAAVDAADRLPARAVRGGDRRAQALEDAGAEGDPRCRSWRPTTTRWSAR